MNLSKALAHYSFPSDIDCLCITDEVMKPAVTVRITLAQQTLLETTLSPYAREEKVTLTGLASIVADHLPESLSPSVLPSDLTLKVFAENTLLGQTIIVPLSMRAQRSADEVIRQEFLTLASHGEKLIPVDAVETLTWIVPENYDPDGPSETTLQVTAHWYNVRTHQLADTTTEQEATLHPDAGSNPFVAQTTLRPSELPAPDASAEWQLLSFDATTYRRRITYRMLPHWLSLAATPTAIQFRNAFGCMDTLYFFGKKEEEVKPTYTSAQSLGRTRNYRIEVNPEWKVTSGPLNATGLRLMHDIIQSLRLVSMATGEELTLTSCELKPTNDLYTAPTSATITYRTAEEGQALPPSLRIRTFDRSFDHTYL